MQGTEVKMMLFEFLQMVLLLETEEKWPHFKEEPHNIRISLVGYGVNPFSHMKSIYTVWPIFVINNNIPPWLSIKREHIILSTIIPSILCLQLFYF